MIPIQKWMCGDCGSTHTLEDDAHDCCRPPVSVGFECGECQEFHDTFEDASACCDDAETATLISRGPSGLELERLGQLRLIA